MPDPSASRAEAAIVLQDVGSTSALTPSDRARVSNARSRARSESTRRNYRSQWQSWTQWAEYRGVSAFPAHPDMVEAYLSERAEFGHKPSTLRLAAAAITFIHSMHEVPSPVNHNVRETLKGLAEQYGRGQKQAAALTAEGLAAIRATACLSRRGRGGRMETAEFARRRGLLDIAMISLMRDALLRVGEAAELTWGDLEDETDGTGRLTVHRSKTDREARGAVLFVSAQTMAAMNAVRNGAGPQERIFDLSVVQMTTRIKAAAKAAGLGEGYSGHSARVGMARDLVRAGTELTALMNAGRWQSHDMPAHYTRAEEAGRGAVARYYGAA